MARSQHERLNRGVYMLAGPTYLSLCNVDPGRLQPEASQLNDCDVLNDPADYSCFQRATAKLLRAIPDEIDPSPMRKRAEECAALLSQFFAELRKGPTYGD